MASVGDALVYSVIIISGILVLGWAGSFEMFALNAESRGYDIDNGYDFDGCYSKYGGISLGVTHQFCKSDYGFLGYNEWILNEDKQFVKESVSSMVGKEVSPECAYGVESFKLTSSGTETIIEYSCNLP